jgi:hypothetical protein
LPYSCPSGKHAWNENGNMITPEKMRDGSAKDIFKKRNKVMQEAKRKNPECWGSRDTIFWGAPEEVILNPEVSTC